MNSTFRFFLLILLFQATFTASAQQVDIFGPLGSGLYGTQVVVLPNGNFVVTDPGFDTNEVQDVGAVYLYESNVALISTLTGSQSGDSVGSNGVTVLANGHFVVCSPLWDNAEVIDAGAATWVNGETGLSGAVSSANSLVGTSMGDQICRTGGIVPLGNGNYVVQSTDWDSGLTAGVGAVTWGSGDTGIAGPVSSSNSLVGSSQFDFVGEVIALSNGNYVVNSELWNNGPDVNAGAVTWGDGEAGVTGIVSTSNSLVGTANPSAFDADTRVIPLSNGNYVIANSTWDNGSKADVGAVTWANGTIGLAGLTSTTNSLIGSKAGDRVGLSVTALTNGSYVAGSWVWDNGSDINAGAATWVNGSTGLVGVVSAENSLVGSSGDRVSSGGITSLSNGHYVVGSSSWRNGAIADAGAVTWGNGETGTVGVVTAANSIIGSSTNDRIGARVTALANGNYVISSFGWDNSQITPDVGAVTWVNGSGPTSAVVSDANSLIGTRIGDSVGLEVVALPNGNYVVGSPLWSVSNVITNAGAATWGDGNTGIAGMVSAANSLTGSAIDDGVGRFVVALSDGNYLAISPTWDNGAIFDAGAVSWGDGATGRTGIITAANSFIGQKPGDQAGSIGAVAERSGFYIIHSPLYDFGAVTDSGAVSMGRNLVGVISTDNSVVGFAIDAGSSLNFDYNPLSGHLIVGQPLSNIVSFFEVEIPDQIFENGFE